MNDYKDTPIDKEIKRLHSLFAKDCIEINFHEDGLSGRLKSKVTFTIKLKK